MYTTIYLPDTKVAFFCIYISKKLVLHIFVDFCLCVKLYFIMAYEENGVKEIICVCACE